MTLETRPLDVVEHLTSYEIIDGFLNEIVTCGASQDTIRQAFKDAERARAKLEQRNENVNLVDTIFDKLAFGRMLSV